MAEFGYGDPEFHRCQSPATHKGKDWDQGKRVQMRVCKTHSVADFEPYPVTFYRFRSLLNS